MIQVIDNDIDLNIYKIFLLIGYKVLDLSVWNMEYKKNIRMWEWVILYREKVSRGQNIAKFYVLIFVNDLLQLISPKINLRDQQKKCISRGINFRD